MELVGLVFSLPFLAKLGIAALLGLVAFVVFRWPLRARLQVPSPILPAHELKRRYGLYAEARTPITLDPSRVPPHLRDLVPLAETWGIGDDIIRADFEDKASEAAKRELVGSLAGRVAEIQEWLDRQPAGAAEVSEEAAAFMCLLSAWDEVRPVDRA